MNVEGKECRAGGIFGEYCRMERAKSGNGNFCDIAENDSVDGLKLDAENVSLEQAIRHCRASIRVFQNNSGCLMQQKQIERYTNLLNELLNLQTHGQG